MVVEAAPELVEAVSPAQTKLGELLLPTKLVKVGASQLLSPKDGVRVFLPLRLLRKEMEDGESNQSNQTPLRKAMPTILPVPADGVTPLRPRKLKRQLSKAVTHGGLKSRSLCLLPSLPHPSLSLS